MYIYIYIYTYISIRLRNSLTVHDNFDNFPKFQNVISTPTPRIIMTHCMRKLILTPSNEKARLCN